VPPHTTWGNVALKGQFDGTAICSSLPSWRDVLKGEQLRLLWLQHSSVSSAVMSRVGRDGVYLICRRHKTVRPAVHQGEEWNLKLSHQIRKTDRRK